MLRKSKLLLTSKKTNDDVEIRVCSGWHNFNNNCRNVSVEMFSSIEPLKYFSHVLFHYGQIHNHTWNCLRFTLWYKMGFGSNMFQGLLSHGPWLTVTLIETGQTAQRVPPRRLVSLTYKTWSDKKRRTGESFTENNNQIFDSRSNFIWLKLCRIVSMLPVSFCKTCLTKIV